MLYVGLYQVRAVHRLWCPLSGGCEAVADAPFARPFGIPDGFIALGLYLLVLALLSLPVESLWLWSILLALAFLAIVANVLGVYDMVRLGAFCSYCLFTTLLSPFLLWTIWRLR
jgi:uncharacterized membrane protein